MPVERPKPKTGCKISLDELFRLARVHGICRATLSAALARLLEGVELLGEALEHRRLRHLLDEHLG